MLDAGHNPPLSSRSDYSHPRNLYSHARNPYSHAPEYAASYCPDGEVVKRFGFHTFRHSLATCVMDEQENPAVVQAIMRHSKMDMTLYYSHSRRSAKRAAQEKVVQRLVIPAAATEMRVPETVQ
jgi:integrase